MNTMLQYELCKRNGGFLLWGDYNTLKPLRGFVLDLSKNSLILDEEGLLPAFAYDLRKAYEGQREKTKVEVWDDELTIYGVEQVWPTFITQVALVRSGLAFVDSTKGEQSYAYLLEDFMEKVLRAAFPKEFDGLLEAYNRLVGIQENSINDILGSRVAMFLHQNARQRKAILTQLLHSIDPMWEKLHQCGVYKEVAGCLTPNDFEGYDWYSLDTMDEKTLKL